MLCGLIRKHKRQLCFKADLYQMVACLFQSVTEEEQENTARPCNLGYKNTTGPKQKLKTFCLLD